MKVEIRTDNYLCLFPYTVPTMDGEIPYLYSHTGTDRQH